MFGKKKPQFTDEIGASARESLLIRTLGPVNGRRVGLFLEIVQIFVLSLALVVLIRTFLVQPFYVKGASMEPNYQDKEYLIIDELTYRFRTPERGETIVFRYPRNPKEFFIKRVIGLPGETVEVFKGKIRLINKDYPKGVVLDEEYLTGIETSGDIQIKAGENEYILLGDNRDHSLDSRVFGAVNFDSIVGRVWFRGWPPGRLGTQDLPDYNI